MLSLTWQATLAAARRTSCATGSNTATIRRAAHFLMSARPTALRNLSEYATGAWATKVGAAAATCGPKNMHVSIATSQFIAATSAGPNFSWWPADLQATIRTGRAD